MRKPFIVAEISANHLGDFSRASKLVYEAKQCGADGVKFQTFNPDDMVMHNIPMKGGQWDGQKLRDLYVQAHMPYEWHEKLFNYAKKLGIVPFSSPFSVEAVDFLETLDCPIYKVASFELIDTPLIRRIAKTGKQIVMSTGMAEEDHIKKAIEDAQSEGPRDITLLKCTSAYPSTADSANLMTMEAMYFQFKTHVGISDHSPGIGVACAAAAMGARIIEKHLTLKRSDGGPDASFSMEPDEFSQLVIECRRAAASVGKVTYGHQKGELSALRRSLYFNQSLPVGTVLSPHMVRTARPFVGLSPQNIDKIIGKTILKDVKRGEPVTWEHIQL